MTEYSNNCRICLAKRKGEDEDDFESIYTVADDQNELTELGKIYQDMFNLLVFPDKTPQYFCNYCILQLKLFHKFRNKAMESYNIFMKSICKKENTSECDYKPEIELQVELAERNGEVFENLMNESEDFEEVQYLEEYLTEDENGWCGLDLYDESSNNGNSESNFYGENEMEMKQNYIIEREDDEYEENTGEDSANNKIKTIVKMERKPSTKLVRKKFKNKSKRRVNNRKKIIKKENSEDFDCENHSCPYCEEVFNTKYSLVLHKKKDHPRTKYPCNLCPKVLYSEETLRVHINVHNGLPAYQCDECKKTFKQKAHYGYHMMGHRNERNVQCHLCGKGFFNNSDLRIHLRVHNDERRYECDVCHKRFRAHTHMTNHRYSHFEKQLQCEICLQKYSSPNTLRTHIKAVHKNECPYECETCQRRFKRKHHLKAHYKIHQKTRIFLKNETVQLI